MPPAHRIGGSSPSGRAKKETPPRGVSFSFCIRLDCINKERGATAVEDQHSIRSHDLDLLKVMAIFGVVTIHACTMGGYQGTVGSPHWLAALFWGTAARFSVPVFLMCSGALMLQPQKKLPLKKLYGRNLLRLIAAMLVWAMGYKVVSLIRANTLSFQSLLQSMKEVLLFQQEFHFYYLHIIFLVYVFLPVTRGFVRQGKKRDLEYALVLWFVLGILYPSVKQYWPVSLLAGIPQQWLMNMAYAAIGYGVLGYYLKKYPLKTWINVLCTLLGSGIIFFGTWIKSAQAGILDPALFEGMSVGPCLLAIGVFGLGISAGGKMADFSKSARLVEGLSKGSFCVYLVHVFYINCLSSLGWTVSSPVTLLTLPAVVVVILALSFATYFILSKIPLVRDWLI